MAWSGNAKREQILVPDELCVGEQAWIPFLAPGFPPTTQWLLFSICC